MLLHFGNLGAGPYIGVCVSSVHEKGVTVLQQQAKARWMLGYSYFHFASIHGIQSTLFSYILEARSFGNRGRAMYP